MRSCCLALERAYRAKSDTGLKRPHNEDRFVANPQLGLYVICDGMGGNNVGGIAGALALRTIHAYLAEAARDADLPLFGSYTVSMSAQANRLGLPPI